MQALDILSGDWGWTLVASGLLAVCAIVDLVYRLRRK